ncbi:autotransporter outer membrane beta-barrel domain-containing protein [Acidithiobacillus sp. HP-11]|uniref:autotransporter outer membrane beta-barrel domain-containing protein n=1 Tax=Acidithiobacillus sp. HP-11 TaxID=2697656 RepID=UPI00187AC217|nr:autotransporter outer membrane beta-barrel domain-containing protein [Acidithiobacillus sp. HP-11]MBE7566826.1 autotransporter outer membrane beta-barrel domain-containing protein [Acidithiobacillus sp. HP-11]
MKKQMKIKAIIAAVALAVSPVALATTNYTGTTNVSSTVTLATGDTITQPSEFVMGSDSTLTDNAANSTNDGVWNLGTVKDSSSDFDATIAPGAAGMEASGGTGVLSSATSANPGNPLGMGLNITNESPNTGTENFYDVGDQSLETASLAINESADALVDMYMGVNPDDTQYNGNTDETLETFGFSAASAATGALIMSNTTLNIDYTLELENDSPDVVLDPADDSNSSDDTSTINLNSGTTLQLATVNSGNASSLSLYASPGTTLDFNADSGNSVVYGPEDENGGGGLDFTAAGDGVDLPVFGNVDNGPAGIVNLDLEGLNFVGEDGGSIALSAEIGASPTTGQVVTPTTADEIPELTANLDDVVDNGDTGNLTVHDDVGNSVSTPNINVNANSAQFGGGVDIEGDGILFDAKNSEFGDSSNVFGGADTTANLTDDSGGSLFVDGGTVNINDINLSGYNDVGLEASGGNINVSGSNNVSNLYMQNAESSGAYTGNVVPSPNLTFYMTPDAISSIYAADGYSIESGNVLINAATGKYSAGLSSPFLQSASGVSNTFNPTAVYYVYNGADSSKIDGFGASIYSTSDSESVCLGGDCGTTTPTPAPSSPSTPSTPTPTPTPTPAPIHVQVVTPVQEANNTLSNTPALSIKQAHDTQNAIISTGIVGGGPRGLWVKGLGGFSSQGNYSGANYGLLAGYGVSVGMQKRDVAGIAFSTGNAAIGTNSSNYTSGTDYGLWLYGTYYPNASKNWKITGTIGGGLLSNTIDTTALGLPQIAHFGGSFAGAEVRASYWKNLDGFVLSPRLSVGYDQSWTNGYTTHGGSFLDVHVASQSSGQFMISPAVLIGKKFNYRTTAGNHTLFPQIRLGMVENIGANPSSTVSSGQDVGQIEGLQYPHTQGMAEVRLNIISHTQYTKGLSANVSAKELFGGGASSTEFVAALKYRW